MAEDRSLEREGEGGRQEFRERGGEGGRQEFRERGRGWKASV